MILILLPTLKKMTLITTPIGYLKHFDIIKLEKHVDFFNMYVSLSHSDFNMPALHQVFVWILTMI